MSDGKKIKSGYSRRDFLKVLGATGGLAASGCAPEIPEKIIPYVVQPEEIVPGVASWYSASCSECSAGCGTVVRVREGRAVKLEGNKNHPINKGGLCAIGQSSLQAHYDPDRVREPLFREIKTPFKPLSWEEAVKKLASATKESGNTYLVTKPLSGSVARLVRELVEAKSNIKHIEFDSSLDVDQDLAAESIFGSGSRVSYDFSKADVVASFGADYLETWVSPVEFSKAWSQRRKPSKLGDVNYTVSIQPRLSLTAVNANKWIKNKPGSELKLLLALLKTILSHKGKADNAQSQELVSSLSVDELLNGSGVSKSELDSLAKTLTSAKNSLVISGGSSSSFAGGKECAELSLLINQELGNISKTVFVFKTLNSSKESNKSFYKLLEALDAGKETPAAVIFADVNPVFVVPGAYNLEKSLARVPFMASISLSMDETAKYANLVLPMSSSLESWGDSEPRPGIYNLSQPAMQPLYKTQSLGDILIALGSRLGVEAISSPSFYEYIRSQWKSRTGESGFERRWIKFVEQGGDWSSYGVKNLEAQSKKSLAGIKKVKTEGIKERAKSSVTKDLVFLSYATIKSANGNTANRPWMQELPDPLTTAVWGSWIDIHPETASANSLSQGNVVRVRTESGVLHAPINITSNVAENVVAMPIGQGHEAFGRYASGIGANAFEVLPVSKDSQVFASIVKKIERAVGKDELVTTQQFFEQFDRGILRTVAASKLAKEKHGHAKHKKHKEGEHHDPLALGPQDEPKQMYKQMTHPLYRWAMSIDLASCTGCSACVVACYAENNIPVVGKELVAQGREMSWIRIQHFNSQQGKESPIEGFMPMLCQHCNNAPCEPVCPVYATYHNEEGINHMVYNRCVGTRYCGNNCSYKVRRFNWFQYKLPEPLTWQLNPDVTVRALGVMEKCTFCVQRIRESQHIAKDEGRVVKDGEVQPACASTCPTDAITFGNILDKKSAVYKNSQSERGYKVLDAHINTQPAITYLAKIENDKVRV